MNNYEYIIASLPVPEPDGGTANVEALIEFIRSQCSDRDSALIARLEDGFDPQKLNYGFYSSALESRNRFLREFLRFDMLVRNTKVEYLNRVLERKEGEGIIPVPGMCEESDTPSCPDFDEKPEVMAVLEQDDILAREKGLDRLLWNKADELTRLRLFDMDVILAIVAKLLITERWNRLDPESGRELFRNLIQEIRNTR